MIAALVIAVLLIALIVLLNLGKIKDIVAVQKMMNQDPVAGHKILEDNDFEEIPVETIRMKNVPEVVYTENGVQKHSYLLYQGTENPKKALHKLAEQIKETKV